MNLVHYRKHFYWCFINWT